MPCTSCSGEYPDITRFFNSLTKFGTNYKSRKKQKSWDYSNEQGLTRLKCGSESGFAAHISVTRQTPVRRTAWFFSLSSCRVVGTNTSIRSGTLRMILIAHRAACVCECLFVVVVVYLFVVVVCVLMNLADDVRVG